VKDLFDRVRAECLSAIWSQGVKLARAKDGVVVERENEQELVLRVVTPGRATYATAVLYLGDLEWACDCSGPADPCQHVAAAVIAAHHARERGETLARADAAAAALIYVLRRSGPGELRLERYVQRDSGRSLLGGTLLSTAEQHGIVPGPHDLTVDRILTAAVRGVLRTAAWPALLEALSGAKLELDGAPVRASPEPLKPLARVFDDADAIVLSIERNPELTELLVPGLARCGDVLRALGNPELSGFKLEQLPLRRRYALSEVGALITEALPALEAKLEVSIESSRLPRRTRERLAPRLSFELDNRAHTLSVLPLVVYGEPPRARVDAGQLVHLTGDAFERDPAAERTLADQLRGELNLVPGRRVDFDGVEADRFASRLRAFQTRLRGATAGPLLRETPLEPVISVDGDALNVEFRGSDGAVSAEAVLRAWHDGLSLVPLQSGGWAPLPLDWLSRYGQRITDLLAARDPERRVARAAIPALAALCDELEQPRPPSFAALEPLLRDFRGLPRAELPPDLTAELRGYQRAGVDWLSFLREARLGAVLADDMGLGKTLQALCALRGRTLIVSPTSVLYNWQHEAARFRPGLSVSLYHGPDRALERGVDLKLTTYAILRLDVERLAAEPWDTVILDEAQLIKNPDSQAAQAAYRLDARFPIALSGTPLENRLEELWSILYFTHRGLLGGRSQFRERYALPIEQGDAARLTQLREKIRPFILRRLKREVAPELPPRTDVVLEIELSPTERELYAAVHAAARRDVVEKLEAGGNVLQALEALLRLRQAACHPALVPGQTAPSSSKIEALLEALEQLTAEGHKVLVFSQWTSLLDLVEPHLETANIPFLRLDGSTRDRAGVVGSFQSASGAPILLTSLKAGGTGLNLTAADHVFLLDPWWNPAVEDQAADRAHRIGQQRPVMVYRLIAKDSVEERILSLQSKKRGLADAALEGAGGATGITRDDLMALLA
jgi:superfamily II DNA or RNA helicase